MTSYTLPSPVIDAAQRGDVAAFEEIYNFYTPLIIRCLQAHHIQTELAEDAAQYAMLQTWRDFARNPNRSMYMFKAWLFKVAFNYVADHMRRPITKAQVPIPDEEILVNEDTDASIDIRTAMRSLHEKYPRAYCCIAARASGYGVDEIAKHTGFSYTATKSLLWRGRGFLRDAL